MTELRDARLRQALDQAPDAGLQPPARVRDAIRGAAHQAVQPAWRRWLPAAGGRRTPSWLAAFASVLVASLVVVIWTGQEVPGARPEPRLADQQAPVAVPAPAAAPAPQPSAANESAPPPAPAPVSPAPVTRAPDVKPAPAPRMRAAAKAEEEHRRESTERHDDTERRDSARLAQAPAAAAPPPPPMSAPAAETAAVPATAARFAASPLPAWRQVRISAGGRSVLVPRSQAEGLPSLVTRLLAAPRESAAPVQAALRLELEAQGVLEWSEEGGWRLLPQGDPQRSQLLRADEATSAALRVEAERLLGK